MVDAMLKLHRTHPEVRLLVGGYRHPKNARYIAEQFERLARAGVAVDDVGPHATAGGVAGFEDLHRAAVPNEFAGTGQSGQSGSDDDDRSGWGVR